MAARLLTLTMGQVIAAYNALYQINTGDEVVVTEQGQQRVSAQPYRNFTVPTRIALARNIAALRIFVEAHQTALQVRQHELASAEGRLGMQAVVLFHKEEAEARVLTVDVSLFVLDQADLHLGVNAIPPAAIADLAVAGVLILENDEGDALSEQATSIRDFKKELDNVFDRSRHAMKLNGGTNEVRDTGVSGDKDALQHQARGDRSGSGGGGGVAVRQPHSK